MNMTLLSPFKVSLYVLALALSQASFAKGLDSLQAEPDKKDEAAAPATPEAPTPPAAAENPIQPAVQNQAAAASPPAINNEPDKFYVASGLSWINLSGSKGGWHSGATSDLEAGYKFLTLLQKFDLFGSFRYRPVEVLVDSDQRQYRGIVETYLFGAKGRMALNSKLSLQASAELGVTQTHLNSNDSLRTVDQSLEKSGVDLSLGAGVSYLVLDKFGVGSKIAFGAGAYKSIQIGIDLRFVL